MKKTLTRLSFVASLSLAAALAQTPTTPMNPPDPAAMAQRRVQMLTRFLGLSDAQAAQATTIFTNSATAVEPIRTQIRTAHDAMRTAIKANDAAGIGSAANSIGSLTAQEMTLQGKADAAFYAILTPDQKTKYDQRGRGRMGPGGMGPGGMGPGGMGSGRGGGFGGMRQRPPQQ